MKRPNFKGWARRRLLKLYLRNRAPKHWLGDAMRARRMRNRIRKRTARLRALRPNALVGTAGAALGKSLLAGAVGTAAMTVSSTVEMKLRHRPASLTPAKALSKVLGLKPKGKREQARLSNLVHWGYGTSLGVLRGLLGLVGLRGLAATATYFGVVWGMEQVMLPGLGVARPTWKYGTKEAAIDAWHHLIYAGAASLTYGLLNRRVGGAGSRGSRPVSTDRKDS